MPGKFRQIVSCIIRVLLLITLMNPAMASQMLDMQVGADNHASHAQHSAMADAAVDMENSQTDSDNCHEICFNCLYCVSIPLIKPSFITNFESVQLSTNVPTYNKTIVNLEIKPPRLANS